MTNVPISAEQIRAMAVDSTTQLLQSLGLVLRKPESDDPRRYRGVNVHKQGEVKTWEQRCAGWLHGTLTKKGPNGEFLYRDAENPITTRWDADDRFKESCSEESRKEFGRDFTRNMALEADELARHEKQMSAIRAVENAIPSWQRRELYDAPLVRSTQAGGSGTRRRVGTEDEARAIAAVKGRGKNTGKDKGRGAGKGQQRTWII